MNYIVYCQNSPKTYLGFHYVIFDTRGEDAKLYPYLTKRQGHYSTVSLSLIFMPIIYSYFCSLLRYWPDPRPYSFSNIALNSVRNLFSAFHFSPLAYFPAFGKQYRYAIQNSETINRRHKMKATGIVRRIDDLGRVVIPKEIRRTMRIREGDPLEIYTSPEGEVVFRKYSALGEMSENAAQVAEIMQRLAGCGVLVFDRDHVVAVAGTPKKEFAERRASQDLEALMMNRHAYYAAEHDSAHLRPSAELQRTAFAALPILTAGDVTGAVAFLDAPEPDSKTVPSDLQRSLISAAAQFLGKQMEA